MTIAISLKVNDGVVLASDSASTLFIKGSDSAPPAVHNVYNNADKIFNLHKELPIGAITWGAGGIGTSSIATLVKDFRTQLTNDEAFRTKINEQSWKVETIAETFCEFIFTNHYQKAFADWPAKPELGFIIAGYSPGNSNAEEYRIDVTNSGECQGPVLLRSTHECGLVWNGEPEAISRLVIGHSPALYTLLQSQFGVEEQQMPQVTKILLSALQAPLIAPPMPIQDAIDLAEFLVDLTIKFSRFMPGASTVGGPIDIAAITKHEGFRWIKRKHYYSVAVNPRREP